MKKSIYGFKNKGRKTNFILFLIILISVFLIKFSWAQNIPIVGDILEEVVSDENDNYSNFMEIVNQTKSYNGIELKLDKASADNNILILSFVIKNTEKIEDLKNIDVNISNLKVNGKKVSAKCNDELNVIDDNTIELLKKIYWNYDDIPYNLLIEMSINKICNKTGIWEINFNLENGKIVKNTHTEKLDTKIRTNDVEGKINKVILSPMTTNITYEIDENSNGKMGFLVVDGDNNELQCIGENSISKFQSNIISYQYINNADLNQVKIIPICFLNKFKEKALEPTKINLEEFHQFYLSVTDSIAIKIKDCVRHEDKLIVKYSFEYLGKPINTKLSSLFIIVDGNKYDENDDTKSRKLKKSYYDENSNLAIFDINEAVGIEIGCYDGTSSRLLEDEIIIIENN